MSPRVGLDTATILQAATEIADTEGMEAVTLATLAKKLNVRPPSLYNHMAGLGELRQMLAMHGLAQLNQVMTQAAMDKEGDEAVRAISWAYLHFVRTHPGLYDATLHAQVMEIPVVQEASSRIVELAVKVLERYGLAGEAAIHAVRGLRSILHGFASIEKLGGFRIGLDPDKSVDALINMYLAGIPALKEERKE